jgi:surface protein
MSKLQTLIKNKQSRYKQSGIKEIFKDENGAIDLASIMVGVLVIGLIGGVIASTVFAVIPWAQDNAAKQQLDSIVQAENAYYGLSAATPSPLPAGYMVNSFANSTDLEKANLLKTNARYCAVTTNGGKGYEGYSQSGSGKIWSLSDTNPSPTAFTGTLPTDCVFITVGFESTPTPAVPYVDPTPTKTILTYQCDATTALRSPIETPNAGGTYTWSDGTTTTVTADNAVKTLTAGVKYTLIYEGTFYAMTSASSTETRAGANCIRSLDHWGSASAPTNANYAFYGATNLTSVPANIPTTLTGMSYMFFGATSFNDANVRSWDVSKVTNMYAMFNKAASFNQDLSNWNVGNVTDMGHMFNGATAMNSALNSWNTLKVTNMDRMFFGASSFNQPLDKWVTTNVTNMLLMFHGAPYTQNLTTWDMNKISKMGMMLNNPDSAQLPRTTHPLMTRLTYQCDATTAFRSPIETPNATGTYTWSDGTTVTADNSVKTLTAGVKYTLIYEGTFYAMTSSSSTETKAGAKCIRSVDHWGSASAPTKADYAFYGATNLTSVPANIPTTLTSMISMFNGATSFNDANVRSWDVSKITNMNSMFAGATAFNQDLSGWNTAAVTSGTLFAPAAFPDAYLPPKTSK